MNVLIVFTGPLIFDGINISTIETFEMFEKDDFNIFILSSISSNDEVVSMYENAGCKVIKCEYRKKSTIKYYNLLKKIIKDKSIDLIHVMGNSTTISLELFAAKKCGVKVRIAHSRNTTCRHKMFNKILRPVFEKSVNYRFACGRDAGKWMFRNKEFEIMKNGKKFEKYSFSNENRINYRKQIGATDKELLIGHVGVFNLQKNHIFIVEIAKELIRQKANFKIVLVGAGSKRDDIINLVKELSISEYFVFLEPTKEINKILSAMDIMILPSLYEGLPNVVVEWQINGLPCLVSNNVTDECKINDNVEFLPIDNSLLWAEGIIRMKDRRIYDESIIKSNLIKNGFDIVNNARKLKEIYLKYYKEMKLVK